MACQGHYNIEITVSNMQISKGSYAPGLLRKAKSRKKPKLGLNTFSTLLGFFSVTWVHLQCAWKCVWAVLTPGATGASGSVQAEGGWGQRQQRKVHPELENPFFCCKNYSTHL